MKIAMVLEGVLKTEGQGRVAYEIVKAALDKGFEVTLFAIRVESELITLGARWIPITPHRWPAALFIGREFVHLATKEIKKHSTKFDVIHTFGYGLDIPHQVNSVQFVHSAWIKSAWHTSRVYRNLYGLYQWIFTSLNARWERNSFFQASCVIACSSLVKEELLAVGVPTAKIHTINNATDPDDFKPGVVDRGTWNLPNDVVLAVFAGDIRSPRKNLETVLHALVDSPDIHLAVVGNIDKSPYPKLADQLGLTARVHFLGFRKDVQQIMQAADLFVFPSRYEPFGLVLLEAMASGLPVITSASVGASDLVTPDSGFVLPNSEDAREIAKVMNQLVSNPALRKKMGEAGREIALQNNWTQMCAGYLAVYKACHAGIIQNF